jgi:hypothetical protein
VDLADHSKNLRSARPERIQQVFIPLVESADDKAAMIVIKAQERKATLMGNNAPLRVDPIALAAEAGPKLNSTEKIAARLENFFAQRRLVNGGEELALREAKAAAGGSDAEPDVEIARPRTSICLSSSARDVRACQLPQVAQTAAS